MRRLWAWVLTVPLSLLGVEAAHALGNLLFGSPERNELFATEAAFRADVLPAAVVVAAALALSLTSRALGRWPRNGGRHIRAMPFALLAPVAFVALEFCEAFAAGNASLATVSAPAFAAGLVFQLPFAFAALLIARALLVLADAVSRLLRPAQPRRRAPHVFLSSWLSTESAPRAATARSTWSSRGPPHLSSV